MTTHTTQISRPARDDERAASIRAMLAPEQIEVLVCAPLTIQNKDLGALLIWSKQELRFIEQERHMLALFADQAALALSNAYLHALNRQLAVEQERQRLARELHDSVTQTLYSMGMAAETALRLIDRESIEASRGPVLHIHQLSQIALKEIRERVHNLSLIAFVEKTLAELLEAHCILLHKQHGLVVERVIDPKLKLTVYQRENLFYIVKEALWNVIKHAPGARVNVSATLAHQLITLSIVDNGPGFVPPIVNPIAMFGLRSMRERAALLNGSFTLESKPGQGTQVTVQIPVNL